MAGSLVLGAILGGAITYYAFPRVMTVSSSTSTSAGGSEGRSSSWNTASGQHEPQYNSYGSPGEAEQKFGDRLNKALLAARAGEAAAQQGLLVRS